MAFIDIYRSNVTRKKSELSKLTNERAKETAKKAQQKQKILSANSALKNTKSQYTVKAKKSEIERAEKEIASIEKKLADIEKKISQKDGEIASEEKKIRTEEERIRKKQEQEDKKRQQENEKILRSINQNIAKQQQEQLNMRNDIRQLKAVPEKITVLFFATNPIGTSPLRLDAEARTIQEMIRKSEHRDSITFETRWAVRPLDILQAINEVNPDVVHFSGHGAESGELVLENTDGSPRSVPAEAITQTIMASSDKIHLLFFNACFSCEQAESVVKSVDVAIGMLTSIGDSAACVFAAQFYSALGFGHSVKRAFDQAKAALILEVPDEAATPALYCNSNLSAESIFLVKPKAQ